MSATHSHDWRARTAQALRHRLSLRADQADPVTIDRAFRDGVEFRGTNVWLLVAAIFIASIGLNVNSTAVIIGAMLISPLMGPIMGIGYGVAISDFELLKRAFRALSIAVAASVATSTAYFLISPLAGAQSELLARTTPTLWDLLIALFGGLVGAVGATRREKSNVVPGVAIATALMPPLCTAGYGIATAQLSYFLGAFYLFFINSVYIGLATTIVIGLMRRPEAAVQQVSVRRKLRWGMYFLISATVLPSVALSLRLVRAEWFSRRAQRFLTQELATPGVYVAERRFSPDPPTIEVALLGARLSPEAIANLQLRLAAHNLAGARLLVRQVGDPRVEATSQRTVALGEMLSGSQVTLSAHDQRLQALERQLQAQEAAVTRERDQRAQLQAALAAAEAERAVDLARAASEAQLLAQLAREVTAHFPQVAHTDVYSALRQRVGAAVPARLVVVRLSVDPKAPVPQPLEVAARLEPIASDRQVEVIIDRPSVGRAKRR